MRRITAIVADTSPAGRALCDSALQHEGDIIVVAHAGQHDEALAAAIELGPRILLCSRRFASPAHYSIFDNLRERCPATLGVLWADDAINDDELIIALAMGAMGFVDGNKLRRELPVAIRRINDGEAWVRRRMLGAMRRRVFA